MPKFVVVSIADNGVVHVWGDGRITDNEVEPFKTRSKAESARKKGKRKSERYGEDVKYSTCKVLGWESAFPGEIT